MPPAKENWFAVVEQVVAGDRVAFVKLSKLVTGFLIRERAFDFRDDWDDVVQEVVVATVEAVRNDRIENPDAVVGYVRRAAHFKFVDRIRQRKREAPDADPEEEAHGSYWSLAAPIDSEKRVAVWEAVRGLSEKQQVAVLSVYAEGHTYGEAAERTGIPWGR